MRKNKSNAGFLLPLVICGFLSMVFFILFVQNMNSAFSRQVVHSADVSRCRAIANTGFSRFMALLRNKTWNQRPFAAASFTQSSVPATDGDGEFDLYVENTAGKEFRGDLYIRTRYRTTKRMFFWRFQYESSLLDSTGRFFTVLFTGLDPNKFPENSQPSPTNEIDDIIATRKAYQEPSDNIALKIRPLDNLPSILEVLEYLDPTLAAGEKDPTVAGNGPPPGGVIPTGPNLPSIPEIPIETEPFPLKVVLASMKELTPKRNKIWRNSKKNFVRSVFKKYNFPTDPIAIDEIQQLFLNLAQQDTTALQEKMWGSVVFKEKWMKRRFLKRIGNVVKRYRKRLEKDKLPE